MEGRRVWAIRFGEGQSQRTTGGYGGLRFQMRCTLTYQNLFFVGSYYEPYYGIYRDLTKRFWEIKL